MPREKLNNKIWTFIFQMKPNDLNIFFTFLIHYSIRFMWAFYIWLNRSHEAFRIDLLVYGIGPVQVKGFDHWLCTWVLWKLRTHQNALSLFLFETGISDWTLEEFQAPLQYNWKKIIQFRYECLWAMLIQWTKDIPKFTHSDCDKFEVLRHDSNGKQ